VKEIFIEDLREEFVRDYVFPMFRCAAIATICVSGPLRRRPLEWCCDRVKAWQALCLHSGHILYIGREGAAGHACLM